jgi:hypothetical protein
MAESSKPAEPTSVKTRAATGVTQIDIGISSSGRRKIAGKQNYHRLLLTLSQERNGCSYKSDVWGSDASRDGFWKNIQQSFATCVAPTGIAPIASLLKSGSHRGLYRISEIRSGEKNPA